jgi:hypothetical protein
MLNGLAPEVVGILAAAIDKDKTCLLTDDGGRELLDANYYETNLEELREKFGDKERQSGGGDENWEKTVAQVKFCLEDSAANVGNIAQKYASKANGTDPRLQKLHSVVRAIVRGRNFTKILKLRSGAKQAKPNKQAKPK